MAPAELEGMGSARSPRGGSRGFHPRDPKSEADCCCAKAVPGLARQPQAVGAPKSQAPALLPGSAGDELLCDQVKELRGSYRDQTSERLLKPMLTWLNVAKHMFHSCQEFVSSGDLRKDDSFLPEICARTTTGMEQPNRGFPPLVASPSKGSAPGVQSMRGSLTSEL